jgi:predicted phage baseplate assembly protein
MSTCDCGCCTGVTIATPAPAYNRPGLPTLGRRVGTHGRFMESMRARLSSAGALAGLTTREPDDPSIAMLDGWAVIADVLTFYQERIANEGYLRTATEPGSLVELGRLVGYTPRPALASSVYLAYSLDPGSRTTIPAGSQAKSVPAQGEQPQTFETMDDLQAREEWSSLAVRRTGPPRLRAVDVPRDLAELTVAGTSANLKAADRMLFLFGAGTPAAARVVMQARPDFAADTTAVSLVPPPTAPTDPVTTAADQLRGVVAAALTSPPMSTLANNVVETLDALTATLDLNEGGPPSVGVLIDYLRVLLEQVAVARPHAGHETAHWLDESVTAVLDALRRVVALSVQAHRMSAPEMEDLTQLASSLLCPQLSPPDSPFGSPIGGEPDECHRAAALIGLTPMLAALRKPPSTPPANARSTSPEITELFAPDSDVSAKLLMADDPRLALWLYRAWGNAAIAPPLPLSDLQVMRVKARPFIDESSPPSDGSQLMLLAGIADQPLTSVQLDAVYDGIIPGSWVIVEDVSTGAHVLQVTAVAQQVATQFVGSDRTRVPVPITVLSLVGTYPDDQPLENITVWAQGESLQAVGDPITDDVQGKEIELDRAYDGLQPGRWLIVSGERTDVPYTSGVLASELVMVGGIRQRVNPELSGDTVHATLVLVNALAYSYKRDTVRIYGNVVAATQGETRPEVLGSGDATGTNQTFSLRQVSADRPLTALPADNALGAAYAITVRVNGVRWHGADVLVGAAPTDHQYALRTGAGSASVVFGDGVNGARPPTGVENIAAEYRAGAGRSGNVAREAINQLGSRPLGVNAVVNPLPATGGSEGDGPDDARVVTPLRVLALDRLLSTKDYENFSRARAGIGKATARRLFDGEREVVHVTIAGMDDVPIDPASQLFIALESALADVGDVHLPVRVAVRDLVAIVLSAGVRVLPDYSWDLVEPLVRAAVLETLGFRNRELGQPAFLSTVVSAIQAIPGVDYVDVDVFKGISADVTPLELITRARGLNAADPCVPASPAWYDEKTYQAHSDETLSSVARQFGLTLDELAGRNPQLESTALQDGQTLVVFRGIRPAQLAVLSPAVPETLTLRRIP